MKNRILALFICIFILFICFYVETSSSNFELIDENGKKILCSFIENKNEIKIRFLDTEITNGNKRFPFVTIINKEVVGVNDKFPINICNKFFIFRKDDRKVNIINNVTNNMDTIYFSGFRFYNVNVGNENETFKLYKIYK